MSTFTYNEETYPQPKDARWNRTPNEMYYELEKIDDDLIGKDDDARVKFLKSHGFESAEQFDAYRSHVTDKVDFMALSQSALNDALNEHQEKMASQTAAMKDTVLAPIAGVSLEVYAAISAQSAQGRNQSELLKQYGIESVNWDKAFNGWNDRMRTDTTFTVTTEYSRLFMAAGQGQFGDIAQEVAATMKGGKSTKENPVTLEQYAEIMAAQGVAASQGKDVNQVLASYGLNAADWGTIGGHWSNKMMTDMTVGMKFGELYSKFTDKLSSEAPKAGDGIDF